MANNLIEFPRFLLRHQSISFDLSGNSQTGGRTLAGDEVMSRSDGGGLWVAKLNDIHIVGRARIRTWRALTAMMDGGATPVVVPLPDRSMAGVIDAAGVTSINGDGSRVSDGSVYVSPSVVAATVASSPLRGTVVRMSIVGLTLQGGEHF